MKIDDIARVCHEANRVLQIVQDDPSIPVSEPWLDLDEETKQSACVGVRGILDGNDARESHATWMQFKLDNGWTLGSVKDHEAKTHPLLVPYDQLPEEQQLKDHLFQAIVLALAPALDS